MDSQKHDPSSQQCKHNSERAAGLLAPPELAVMTSWRAALPQEEQSKEEEPCSASTALRQQGLSIV